jgi:hypothetical protein
MNGLVRTKIKPVLEKAVLALETEIAKASSAVEAWEKRWGTVPEQPILDKEVQDRIKRLILGEEVEKASKAELQIAGLQIDKVINVL